MRSKDSGTGGLLVTNHLNLMFSLASGLITPPSGFGDKYYEDTLSEYPGWLPLCIEKVPLKWINLSIREAKHLIPVIVEIDLTDLECLDKISVWGIPKRKEPPPTLFDEENSVESKSQNRRSESLSRGMILLVQGTISVTRIRKIYLQSEDDKGKFLSQVHLRNNVPLRTNQVKRKKTLFTQSYKKWQDHRIEEKSLNQIQLNMAQAKGGILAMLHHVRGKGQEAGQVYEGAFDAESKETMPDLNEWMRNGSIPSLSESEDGYLLWNLVETIARQRDRCNDSDLEELVLEFLENILGQGQHSVSDLCKTLRQLGGLGAKTVSEYFVFHKNPLERALILFFLRHRCQELLDFEDTQLSAMDWVYSAILFGARSGWLRLPLELRGDETLEDRICARMVSFCHRITG